MPETRPVTPHGRTGHGKPPGSGTYVSDRALASELRRIRENLKYTGDRVARALDWSPAKISRIELGRTGIRLEDLTTLLDFYQLPAEKTQGMLALARRMADPGVSGYRDAWLGRATQACTVLEWAPQVIPLLLQVPGYARAVLASGQAVTQMPPGRADDIAGSIAAWQDRLRAEPPVRLRAVIDESVLYRHAAPVRSCAPSSGSWTGCAARKAPTSTCASSRSPAAARWASAPSPTWSTPRSKAWPRRPAS
jgi:transcriptional regulator with XRE-family HTH domain